MDACMFFGRNAAYGIECLGARKVSREEALTMLEGFEQAGLIHQTQNTTDGVGYLCNCDRWHCYTLKIVLKQPNPSKLFNSGFDPRFDPDLCTACGTCIDRCPPEALKMGSNDIPDVDFDRCFGCAVCASGCPTGAIKMVNKPGFKAPPKDQKALTEAMMASFAAQS
jgi:Pyruvate/2-oxoacid:ferredoxin oxidoreductase delta subunit